MHCCTLNIQQAISSVLTFVSSLDAAVFLPQLELRISNPVDYLIL